VPRTSANSLAVTPQGMIGAADQRTRGSLAAGHYIRPTAAKSGALLSCHPPIAREDGRKRPFA